MYPVALDKSSNPTVDSSKVFENWNFQKQKKDKPQIDKKWEQLTIRDLEQVFSKQGGASVAWLLSTRTVSPNLDTISPTFI